MFYLRSIVPIALAAVTLLSFFRLVNSAPETPTVIAWSAMVIAGWLFYAALELKSRWYGFGPFQRVTDLPLASGMGVMVVGLLAVLSGWIEGDKGNLLSCAIIVMAGLAAIAYGLTLLPVWIREGAVENLEKFASTYEDAETGTVTVYACRFSMKGKRYKYSFTYSPHNFHWSLANGDQIRVEANLWGEISAFQRAGVVSTET